MKKKKYKRRWIVIVRRISGIILFSIFCVWLVKTNQHQHRNEEHENIDAFAVVNISNSRMNREEIPVIEEPIQVIDWKLLLINQNNKLDASFQVDLKTLKSGHKVDKRIYEDLQNMLDDAKKAGLQPIICSSYRTNETQTRLFQNEVNRVKRQGYGEEQAKEMAAKWVAIPGTSEHQTRTCGRYCGFKLSIIR